ncbi:DUF5103 domain-containing protein [Shivajiella indica]|uniref:DUF5103 domain-containing protein n=1 Tax=Shivajiella indica TaxID=872115 RepID=A0ABW5B704_9BACT
MRLLILFLIFFSFSNFRLLAQQVYHDRIYEENIQSVRLFLNTGEFEAQMNSPVMELNGNRPIMLTFDDLAYDPDMYSAKIIHCNVDWTPSDLKDAEYLNEYNEFNILDYERSIDTRIPYIHYNFVIPRVTKTGNYIIKVYRGRDQNQIILTKRFMVFQNSINLAAKIVPPSQTEIRRKVQQINVNLNYKSRELFDPRSNLKVIIRQNQRWDNMKVLTKPTMIREDIKMIEYNLFDGSNTFWAGNEFRFVDLRFVRAKGVNVSSVRMEKDVVYAEAGVDKVRPPYGVYSQYLDLNGQYAVMNLERSNYEIESEYMVMTFYLDPEEVTEQPYIIGSLTQWGLSPDAKMTLNKNTRRYESTLILKQGWYDYQYAYKSDEGWNTVPIEGSFFETENEYEVFIYYREMGSRYDELISYFNLNPNKRRL